MLIAAVVGALATWGSMLWMDRGLEPQSPEALGNLAALGGVLAGLCGGMASIGRGNRGNREDFLSGLAAIGLGLGVFVMINPALLFSPFLLAKLLARIGEHFPLECPACGVDIRLIAFITDRGPIRKILSRLGEPLQPLPLAPVRGPPTDWGPLVQAHDDVACPS